MRLVVIITNDRYELPVAVCESYSEAGRVLGVTKHAIYKALKYGGTLYHKRYRVVIVIE